jgi:hypothetical protein
MSILLRCSALKHFQPKNFAYQPWRRGLVVSSPHATEETGAMGREIESSQGVGR